MRPDSVTGPETPEHVSLHDLCVLAGLDPALYRGYALVLVPAQSAPFDLLTDAPQPAALAAVLATVVVGIANRLQLDGESRGSR